MKIQPRPIAVTMGDPSGISGEITLKAWWAKERTGLPVFFVIDDPDRLARLSERLGWDIKVVQIENPAEAGDVFSLALPVLPLELPKPPIPGQPQLENAVSVIASIERAVEWVQAGIASAVVTNPIHKKVLYDSGFKYPGHTEFLASLAGCSDDPVMLLACEQLKVVPVTVHQALSQAITSLTRERVFQVVMTTNKALRQDFAIDRPHIMVAALNPHAGEGGTMGLEEIEIIAPAVEDLKRSGYSVTGPTPADTLFHDRARAAYDAVVCMYHDQALIPLKTIDFRSSVNVTLGLPFVRTSPDHGTAFEIAGTGVADESSLVAALKVASHIFMNRIRSKAIPDDEITGRFN